MYFIKFEKLGAIISLNIFLPHPLPQELYVGMYEVSMTLPKLSHVPLTVYLFGSFSALNSGKFSVQYCYSH